MTALQAEENSDSAAWLRIPFYAETNYVATTAALRVREHVYPASRWWESEDANASTDRSAFSAVISAIAAEDRGALLELSDPVEGQDPARFTQQCDALFRQFKTLQITAVRRAYGVSGLLIFAVEIKTVRRALIAPFVFACRAGDGYRFLPYRTEALPYLLVSHWFDLSPLAGFPEGSMFLTGKRLEALTQECALPDGLRGGTDACPAAVVRFRAGSVVGNSAVSEASGKVLEAIARMKADLAKENYDGFTNRVHPGARAKIRGWLAELESEARMAYNQAVQEFEPRFILDASPLIVVYGRTPGVRMQVMYFTLGEDGSWLWTNSSRVTIEDRLFKGDALTSVLVEGKL